jgi:protocatechuate 3,4-dioxygenase alpha subunit
VKSRVTPAQTVGPFFHGALCRPLPSPRGSAGGPGVELRGRVVDGAGAPVADALLELWQTDGGEGAFARTATDAAGEYRVRLRALGPVPGAGGRRDAPHIAVSVFARGLLHRLVTRIYFPDDPANAADPLLASIADPARRARLIARSEPGRSGLRFDLVLQGEGETPFLDV